MNASDSAIIKGKVRVWGYFSMFCLVLSFLLIVSGAYFYLESKTVFSLFNSGAADKGGLGPLLFAAIFAVFSIVILINIRHLVTKNGMLNRIIFWVVLLLFGCSLILIYDGAKSLIGIPVSEVNIINGGILGLISLVILLSPVLFFLREELVSKQLNANKQ